MVVMLIFHTAAATKPPLIIRFNPASQQIPEPTFSTSKAQPRTSKTRPPIFLPVSNFPSVLTKTAPSPNPTILNTKPPLIIRNSPGYKPTKAPVSSSSPLRIHPPIFLPVSNFPSVLAKTVPSHQIPPPLPSLPQTLPSTSTPPPLFHSSGSSSTTTSEPTTTTTTTPLPTLETPDNTVDKQIFETSTENIVEILEKTSEDSHTGSIETVTDEPAQSSSTLSIVPLEPDAEDLSSTKYDLVDEVQSPVNNVDGIENENESSTPILIEELTEEISSEPKTDLQAKERVGKFIISHYILYYSYKIKSTRMTNNYRFEHFNRNRMFY